MYPQAKTNVRVTLISPGAVDTGLINSITEGWHLRILQELQYSSRSGCHDHQANHRPAHRCCLERSHHPADCPTNVGTWLDGKHSFYQRKWKPSRWHRMPGCQAAGGRTLRRSTRSTIRSIRSASTLPGPATFWCHRITTSTWRSAVVTIGTSTIMTTRFSSARLAKADTSEWLEPVSDAEYDCLGG